MSAKGVRHRLNALTRVVQVAGSARHGASIAFLTTGERRRALAKLTLRLCGQPATPDDVAAFLSSGDFGALLYDVEHWQGWRRWAVEQRDPVRVRLFSATIELAAKLQDRRERNREYWIEATPPEWGPEAGNGDRAIAAAERIREQARMVLARRSLPIPGSRGGGGEAVVDEQVNAVLPAACAGGAPAEALAATGDGDDEAFADTREDPFLESF